MKRFTLFAALFALLAAPALAVTPAADAPAATCDTATLDVAHYQALGDMLDRVELQATMAESTLASFDLMADRGCDFQYAYEYCQEACWPTGLCEFWCYNGEPYCICKPAGGHCP